MKNIIKLKSILALIFTMIIMSSCGNGIINSDGGKMSFETVNMEESSFNTKAISDYTKGTVSEKYGGGHFEPSEQLSKTATSYQIQIHDDIYTFPMMFRDFMSYGWKLDSKEKYHVKAQRMARVWFKNGNLRMCFYIYNPDVVPRAYDMCYINGMTTFWDNTKVDENIFIPGGYRLNSVVKNDFFAANTTGFERNDNSKGETFVTYKSGDKSQNRFAIRFDSQGKLNSFELQTFDMPEGFRQVTVDDSKFVNKYKAPKKLGTDPRDGIFSIGDEIYKMPVPLSAFLDNGWDLIETEKSQYDLVTKRDEAVPAEKPIEVCLKKLRRTMRLNLKNPYDDTCLAENCVLTNLPDFDSDNQNFTLILSGDIKQGMSKNDLCSLLEKQNIDYKSSNNVISFKGDTEFGTENVEYSFDISEDKIERIHINFR